MFEGIPNEILILIDGVVRTFKFVPRSTEIANDTTRWLATCQLLEEKRQLLDKTLARIQSDWIGVLYNPMNEIQLVLAENLRAMLEEMNIPDDRYDDTSLLRRSNHVFSKTIPLIELMAKAVNQNFVNRIQMELEQKEHIPDPSMTGHQNSTVRQCLPEQLKDVNHYKFYMRFEGKSCSGECEFSPERI